MFGNTFKLCQTPFGIAPKGFYPIDMLIATGKLVVAMVHPKVFFVADINQAIIGTPTIGIDNVLCTSRCPRMTFNSVALAALGTISV